MAQTALVIDDSRTHRSLIKVLLLLMAGREWSILEAADGQEGLRLARGAAVDVIITDFHMPGMDGLAFVRALREDGNPRVREVPIVVLTAEGAADLPSKVRASGADAFVRKPVVKDELHAAVAALVPPPSTPPQTPPPRSAPRSR
ncbi:MAG TPA: response regulator [Myxococcota bacterium]|jgi:two-component system chemotaxis response regulator CheY|nr:response regulator [Myxococcota bacterium]